MERRDGLTELLTEFDPPGEHLPELAAGLVGGSTAGGRSLAFRVLGPPSNEKAFIVADLFRRRPCKRSVQPALKRQRSRVMCHARTLTLPTAEGLRER